MKANLVLTIMKIMIRYHNGINTFLASVLIFYLLKTPENQRFSGVFRGYKLGTLARNGLTDDDSIDNFGHVVAICLIFML